MIVTPHQIILNKLDVYINPHKKICQKIVTKLSLTLEI